MKSWRERVGAAVGEDLPTFTPEELAAAEAEDRDRDEADALARLAKVPDAMERAGCPRRHLAAALDDLDATAAEAIRATLDGGRSLAIFGAPGTGKTHATVAAIRMRLELAARAAGNYDDFAVGIQWTTARDLITAIRDSQFANSPEERRLPTARFERASYLVIDDLGATSRDVMTDFVSDAIFGLLDRRYLDMTPTLLTMNRGISELAESLGENGPRMASRIVESYRVIELTGKDRRRP